MGANEQKAGVKQSARIPRLGWSAIAASMVAATAIVVLLLQKPILEPLPPPVRPQPLVNAADYNLVVMPTRNPDITILWFYKETDE